MSTNTNYANRRRTKIVCTIGPASRSQHMIEKLARAGMDCARLNFSHETHSEHLQAIDNIRRVSKKLGNQISIIQDLPGPKIRVGKLQNGSAHLRKGSKITVSSRSDVIGNNSLIPVNHPNLPKYVQAGATIFLADGLLRLRVLDISSPSELECKCEVGGDLLSGKGMNIPQLDLNFQTFTDADRHHLEFGLKENVDFVAVSFVRKASDIEKVRKFVEKNEGNCGPSIIAKIEKKEAVDEIENIAQISDAVMVARGDLGVENPIEQVPMMQKQIMTTCRRLSRPVITATQMLESMVNSSSPTRAEVTDIANAILDGTDAVMLSEETAVGKYPVECVEILHKVSMFTELKMLQKNVARHSIENHGEQSLQESIAEAAHEVSMDLAASAIVSPTNTGTLAAKISTFRPRTPIIALTDVEENVRKLRLVWGVYPFQIEKMTNLTDLLDTSFRELKRKKLLNRGETIVVVCDNVKLSKERGELLFVAQATGRNRPSNVNYARL